MIHEILARSQEEFKFAQRFSYFQCRLSYRYSTLRSSLMIQIFCEKMRSSNILNTISTLQLSLAWWSLKTTQKVRFSCQSDNWFSTHVHILPGIVVIAHFEVLEAVSWIENFLYNLRNFYLAVIENTCFQWHCLWYLSAYLFRHYIHPCSFYGIFFF